MSTEAETLPRLASPQNRVDLSPAEPDFVGVIRKLLLEREPQIFARIESVMVREAFAMVHGNQVHAAKLLGLTRNEMRTLLKRYGYIRGR